MEEKLRKRRNTIKQVLVTGREGEKINFMLQDAVELKDSSGCKYLLTKKGGADKKKTSQTE